MKLEMKRSLLIVTLLLSIGRIVAQQDKLLTHFFYDKMTVNPAATAANVDNNGICATSIYRNQWDKVDGAPNTALLNIEANANRYIPGSIGLSFFHDAIGFNRQNSLLLNYAYPLIDNNNGKLSVGLGAGLMNLGMSPTWVPPTSATDNAIPVGFSGTGLDLNLGVHYKSRLGFYAGLSVTHVNSGDLNNRLNQTAGTQVYGIKSHFFLMGGYTYRLQNGNAIDAQILTRSIMSQTSFELNARYIISTLGYAGLTFRASDAVSLVLGMTNIPSVPRLTIGYGYDFTINKLSSVSKGSHEIVLKYCMPIPVPPVTVSRHPRWL